MNAIMTEKLCTRCHETHPVQCEECWKCGSPLIAVRVPEEFAWAERSGNMPLCFYLFKRTMNDAIDAIEKLTEELDQLQKKRQQKPPDHING
jgi:hypothetical protein